MRSESEKVSWRTIIACYHWDAILLRNPLLRRLDRLNLIDPIRNKKAIDGESSRLYSPIWPQFGSFIWQCALIATYRLANDMRKNDVKSKLYGGIISLIF